MKRLMLIDGNAILHRAYHALPPLTSQDGRLVNAVYGFASMFLRLVTDLKPDYLAVAFDRPKPTFRKKLFVDYQAQRPELDRDFISQIILVHTLLEKMKISVFEVDGYEADDVIGTIAKKMQSKKTEVVAVTGDRDLLQLVNSHVKLYMPVKGLSEAKLYGEKEAEERMGVTPRQIPDLKALAGDASDNFPGVAGIGPKTAATLLKEFGTVEKLYNNLEKVKNESVRNKLEKGKEDATLAKTLATVVTDVPIEVDLEKLQLPDFVRPEVVEYFNELGFKTLVKRLTGVEKQNSKRIAQKPQETEKANDNQLGLF